MRIYLHWYFDITTRKLKGESASQGPILSPQRNDLLIDRNPIISIDNKISKLIFISTKLFVLTVDTNTLPGTYYG